MLNKNSENEYHNPEVQEILNQYLTTEKYGDMKPILDEIFHRRMVGFSFSRERIEREIRNFSENCESIEFEKSKNCLGNIISSPLAAYDPQKKKIRLFINPKTIENENSRNLFLSLMHEVYHATATNGFTTGLSKGSLLSNGIIQREGDAVDEIMNEKASMISGKDDTHEEIERDGYESTQGYGGISIFSNMMANALGVSERNLVSHSVGDRQELMDFYLSRFPESDKEEAKEIFENFELDLQSIYQTHYKDSTAVYAISRDGVDTRITDAYKRMSQMFILQTRHDKRQPNDEYYSELITRVEGMKKNYSSINAILSRRELPLAIPEDEVLEEYVASRIFYDKEGISTDEYVYSRVAMDGAFGAFYRLNKDRQLPEDAKYFSQKQRIDSIDSPDINSYKERIASEEKLGITYDRSVEDALKGIFLSKAKEVAQEEERKAAQREEARQALIAQRKEKFEKLSAIAAKENESALSEANAIIEEANKPAEVKPQGFFSKLLASLKNRFSSLFGGNTAPAEGASDRDAKEILIEERATFEKNVGVKEKDRVLNGILSEVEKAKHPEEVTKEDSKDNQTLDD